MTRAQCIVHRKNKVLMAKHRLHGKEWWCLPGGAVEAGETPAEAAIRELKEECGVHGTIVLETARYGDSAQDLCYTYLVDIGDQAVCTGSDPEFPEDGQILVEVRWMALSEIPERDRAFLWAAGLLGIEEFLAEATRWGNAISYP
jgi:8-oxo-dGTP diphosphatase